MPVDERILEDATVEAILQAPVSELRPKPRGYGQSEYAPAFWARVRRIYKEMIAAKAAVK